MSLPCDAERRLGAAQRLAAKVKPVLRALPAVEGLQ
jgi:hypothetical protein